MSRTSKPSSTRWIDPTAPAVPNATQRCSVAVFLSLIVELLSSRLARYAAAPTLSTGSQRTLRPAQLKP